MGEATNLAINAKTAASRFFRLYMSHCQCPTIDTLFNFLNAAHSLNDRLRKAKNDSFFEIDEFLALKAFRNFFHHAGELEESVRLIPITEAMPIYSDLASMCLLPRTIVETVIASERNAAARPKIEGVLKWYGDVVNINPAIFNFAVHAYEKLLSLEVFGSGSGWEAFTASYEMEATNGIYHFVHGDINCHAGSVNVILQDLMN